MHSDFVLINSNSIINLNATHIYVQCSKLMNQEHDVGMLFASYQSWTGLGTGGNRSKLGRHDLVLALRLGRIYGGYKIDIKQAATY